MHDPINASISSRVTGDDGNGRRVEVDPECRSRRSQRRRLQHASAELAVFLHGFVGRHRHRLSCRPQFKNYRPDRVSLNDYANGALGSVLDGNLGVDAIWEFSVLTSNVSAAYGKTAGGVVNAITRPGTAFWKDAALCYLVMAVAVFTVA